MFRRNKLEQFITLRNKDGGAGGAGTGGDPGDAGKGKEGAGGGSGGGSETVSKTEFNKVLDELHTFKRAAKEAEDAKRKSEEDNLRANQEWKTLAERHEQKAKDFEQKYNGLNQLIVKDKKISAIREEALKKGIRQEALPDLEILDHKDVTVETTSTGRINVLGVSGAIENLKTLRPHWFGGSAGPGVNTNTPGVNSPGGEVTIAQITAAEKEMRKTGDATEYNRLSNLYLQQRRAKKGA